MPDDATRTGEGKREASETPERAQQLYDALLETTRSRLLEDGESRGTSARLFPHGVTRVDIELGLKGPDLDLHVVVEGPEVATPVRMTQMTPTASWWFKGPSDDVLGIIALGSTLFSGSVAPPNAFPWTKEREHWFQAPAGLSAALSAPNATLEMRFQHASTSGPTKDLEDDAKKLVTEWNARFLGRTKLYDTQNQIDLWHSGSPPGGPNGNGYFFQASGTDADRPRVYFQLDGQGLLQSATWFADTKYDLLKLNQFPVTLTKAVINAWPTASFYHTSS